MAVESVRAARKQPLSGEAFTVSAADPLNLVGILVPGARVPAISGRTVSFRDGVAVDELGDPGLGHRGENSTPTAFSAD